MRDLTSALLTKLATNYGTEPYNIIEVQWVEGGQRHVYADKDIPGRATGEILELSGLDFVINVNDGSDSAEINIVLSDVDGDIKAIMDANDIHKRDVWVYQGFEGTEDTALIFRGEINSPITWNEGDRTVKFNVISKIEDAEIGFSIEEGQFNNPDPELIGKAWPLKFGTTINVPALRFVAPTKGVLATGIGISDFTLPYRLEVANRIICPLVFRGYYTYYQNISLVIQPIFTVDEGCALSRCELIDDLERQISEQTKYEFNKITVIGGENFPQNTQVTIEIEGGRFTGRFNGNIFTVVSSKHPEFDEIGTLNDAKVRQLIKDRINQAINGGCGILQGGQSDGQGGTTGSTSYPTDPSRQLVEESQKSWEFYNAIPTSEFFWASPGSEVILVSNENLVYVSNLLPETVKYVTAYRTFDGGRKLVTVPKSFYTTRFVNFQTYTTTEIVMARPLSRRASGWEDEIYVTSVSSVGPNTVDIIQWLIEKYTDLEIDAPSFATVKAQVEEYPSDFPILERRNILNVLQEIAFQARCAIYLRDGKFFLKYLPALPAAVETISESDVDSNTLELFHTNTEDIVTKLVAEWQRDYAKPDPNKIILRHNIEKYGTQEEVYNFYIYNELDYVHKSATFWLIRKSNTWRMARLSTPIHKLKLETFDGVDVTLPDFSPHTIRGTITKADYNSEGRRLDFEIWTPVKSGTVVAYDFAHPQDITPELQWPTQLERERNLAGSGSAPGFSTTPPAGHVLEGGPQLIQGFQLGPCDSQGRTTKSFVDQTCGGGNGDTYPSDIEDSKKTKTLAGDRPPEVAVDPGEINVGDGPNSTLGGLSELDSILKRLSDLESRVAAAAAVANAANEAAGGQGSSTQPMGDNPWEKLPKKEDLDPLEYPCQFVVRVYNWRPKNLFRHGEPGQHPTGHFGSGVQERVDNFVFKTRCEANQLVEAIQDLHQQRQDADAYAVDSGPYPINANMTQIFLSQCQGKPPCDEQDRDEEGNAIGKHPTPIAYDKTTVAEPGEGQEEGNPDDYWEDSVGLMDKGECAPNNPGDCP